MPGVDAGLVPLGDHVPWTNIMAHGLGANLFSCQGGGCHTAARKRTFCTAHSVDFYNE